MRKIRNDELYAKFSKWHKLYIDNCKNKLTRSLYKLQESQNSAQFGNMMGRELSSDELRYMELRKVKDDKAVSKEASKILRNIKDLDNTNPDDVLDSLLKHSKVHNVLIEHADEDSIRTIVVTERLRISGDNIGHYGIFLSLRNERDINIRNLEHVVNDEYDHSFIYYGRPCLGSWDSTIRKYYNSGQLFLLIDTFVHFLQSAIGHPHIDFDVWIEGFKNRPSRDMSANTTEGILTPDVNEILRITEREEREHREDLRRRLSNEGWIVSGIINGDF